MMFTSSGWRMVLLAGLTAGVALAQEEAPKPMPESMPEDVASVPAVELVAPGDEAMRYFLIGGSGEAQEEPVKGVKPRKLLIVLPGGDGSADFHPFVRRIHKNVLDDKWLVAQLVAPVWSEGQAEKLVWPTDKNKWPKMRFSTEEYLDAVIEDVESRYAVDPEKVFTLSWSSGGPAAYAAALTKGSKITGSFVAMSVFKPDQLPSLKAAKGKAFYLLHSPDDFIPIRMAEDAEKRLTKQRAEVRLQTYEGGHGWRGNVYGNMRDGIAWLENHHGKPPKRKRKKR